MLAASRRFRARDALVVIAIVAVALLLFEGRAIRSSGETMRPGLQRDVVLAVGRPAASVADALPFGAMNDRLKAWIGPDESLGDGGAGFAGGPAGGVARGAGPVGPEAFDPATLGARPRPPAALRTLLVTGDSMSQPLDAELARRLAGGGVKALREAHIGTGISKSELLDWGRLSTHQARSEQPDAVVVFIGANEGFPMPGPRGRSVACCGPEWAALYATRARRMMDAYRRRGAARVYWLKLPLPRDGERARIARTVNAAVSVAGQPFAAQVRVLDMAALFTPGGRYRASMPVAGRDTIVREPDGIHLNDAGARVAADVVLARVRADFRAR